MLANYYNHKNLLKNIRAYKKNYKFEDFDISCQEIISDQKQEYYWKKSTQCDAIRIYDDSYLVMLHTHLKMLKEIYGIDTRGFKLYIGTGDINSEIVVNKRIYKYIEIEMPRVYLFNQGGFVLTYDSI